MATFAACRTFLHLNVTTLACLLMGKILTKTRNLSTFGFLMALSTVFKSFRMGFVVE
jgi:hypothetical protein